MSGEGIRRNISVFVVEKNPRYVLFCDFFSVYHDIACVVFWFGRFLEVASASSLIKSVLSVFIKNLNVFLCLYCVFTFSVSGVLKDIST